MSNFVALTFLGNETLAPTSRNFESSFGTHMEGYGILQNVSVRHNNVEVTLDFYVFKAPNFELLIGHPIEKLFRDVPRSGNLNIKLGKDSSVPISRSINPLTESIPTRELIEQVMAVSPLDPLESVLEKDFEHFKEDNSGEDLHILTERPSSPSIRLNPLPTWTQDAKL
jgi:hypothetical protein